MSDLEFLHTLLLIRTKESANSRYSGNVTSVIQNFCSGPEILDQFFTSYRNAVQAPNNSDKVIGVLTGNWGPNQSR